MFELYALTAGEALALLAALAAHGTLIGFLVRVGWLAVPRPGVVAVAAPPAAQTQAARDRQERRAA